MEHGVAGYSLLDHTADMGIVATGDDLPAAFANAAQGMFAWMVDLDTVEEREVQTVEATGRDVEALLVDFLNELLFLFDTRGLLFKRLQVQELVSSGDEAGSYRLVAVGFGEGLAPQRHELRGSIKSATYHMLQVQEGPTESRVQVILDT